MRVVIYVTLALTCLALITEAARKEKINQNAKGKAKGRKNKNNASMDKQTVGDMLNLQAGKESVEEQESAPTITGTRKVRVKQQFDGIPIWGSSVTVELDEDGEPTGKANGHILRGIEGETNLNRPRITEEEAFDALKAEWHPDMSADDLDKRNANLTIADIDGKAELVFHVEYYVWPENGDPSKPEGLIDANNGRVYRTWDALTHLEIPDAVAGNEKVGVGLRRLNMDVLSVGDNICYYYSEDVEVQDLQQQSESLPFITRGFPCDAPSDASGFDKINGGYSPLNEVFIYSQNVHDTFVNWVGRPPLGNTDADGVVTRKVKIFGRAHVRSCYDNAFWNGVAIHIGDGCGTFHPLSSIDVVAHEVAHGFTTYTSGLVYSGEHGGMNEAFSDMAGEAVENFVLTQIGQTNDWLIGADIYKAAGRSLRYMEDPTRDGSSIGNYADYRSGMDVHYSSGVYNRAFFLLSNSDGWDIQKAFQVMARANWVEWESESSMACGACGVRNAAVDLGYSYEPHIAAAFAAVGVDCADCA